MEGFKGTRGPWGLDQFGNVVHGPVDGCGRKEKVRVSGVALPGRVTPEYEANTHLVAAAPELLEALQWALPLAKIAMDTHRLERIRCGHMDINGTYKNGETWVGIYQDEVDKIESAQASIAKALGQ